MLPNRTVNQRFLLASQAYGKKLKTYARNVHLNDVIYSREDIEQLLWQGLWTACQHYDPTKGARFNTFLQQIWRNQISKMKRSLAAKMHGPDVKKISMDHEDFTEEVVETYHAELDDAGISLLIRSLKHLNETQMWVCMSLALGMDVWDIAEVYDIDIDQIYEVTEELSYDLELYQGLRMMTRAI